MIVTRRRRKAFPWRRLILPVIAIALVFFAFMWAPSRNAMTGGPMAPFARTVVTTYNTIAQPFHFAVQNEEITGLRHQIVVLQGQLNDAQSKAAAKDKQIASLQSQITQVQAQEAAARSSESVRPAQVSSSAAGENAGTIAFGTQTGAGHGDLSAGATPDMRRTAQYWSNMEPENAAKVVQKLPVDYVARIFSLMSSDAAGSILDALPATFAAELTQEDPSLRR